MKKGSAGDGGSDGSGRSGQSNERAAFLPSPLDRWDRLKKVERRVLILLDATYGHGTIGPRAIDLLNQRFWFLGIARVHPPSRAALLRMLRRLATAGMVVQTSHAPHGASTWLITGEGIEVVRVGCAISSDPATVAAAIGKATLGSERRRRPSEQEQRCRDAMIWMLREQGTTLVAIGQALGLSAPRIGQLAERYRRRLADRVEASHWEMRGVVDRLRRAGAILPLPPGRPARRVHADEVIGRAADLPPSWRWTVVGDPGDDPGKAES